MLVDVFLFLLGLYYPIFIEEHHHPGSLGILLLTDQENGMAEGIEHCSTGVYSIYQSLTFLGLEARYRSFSCDINHLTDQIHIFSA